MKPKAKKNKMKEAFLIEQELTEAKDAEDPEAEMSEESLRMVRKYIG